MGGAAIGLGAQDPAQPLGLLLPRAEGSAHLDRHRGFGQVDAEVRHLAHDEHADASLSKIREETLAFLDGRGPGDDGGVEMLAEFGQLIEVLADDEHLIVRVLRDELLDEGDLLRGRRGEPVPVLGLGHGVGHAVGVRERHANLDAVRGRDVALVLDVLPGGVVALGPDEAEDVAFMPVLAHEGGGQAEPAAALDIGGEPEDRRGEQVDLVIDDEAPVAGVEDLEVRVDALALRRHDLVRRDGDRANLLLRARVFPDLIGGQGGAPNEFLAPLASGNGIRDEDERCRLGKGHGEGADDRLARAAREHDDP